MSDMASMFVCRILNLWGSAVTAGALQLGHRTISGLSGFESIMLLFRRQLHLPHSVSFGKNTKSHWSIPSCVYAQGNGKYLWAHRDGGHNL